ncbi:hypothetical protein ENBRE01_1648 [Enteropsectra breve]|nr:hypothetical protein ENBRE01_1648 [Enteropsectra breve]
MFVVTLLIECLWAASQPTEEEKKQKEEDDRICADIKKNMDVISDALNRNLTEVELPCKIIKVKQVDTDGELRAFLDREKSAQPHNNDANEHINYEEDICGICKQPFFSDENEKSRFAKRVYKTHYDMPKCVMCPTPRCRGGRMCCTCIRTLIDTGMRVNLTKAPLTYKDSEKKRIPNQRMVTCPYCRNYLNFELHELDAVPENAGMGERDKLNYIEDLVNNQNRTYWLLETKRFFTDHSRPDQLFDTVREIIEPKINSFEASDFGQIQLWRRLEEQITFYDACTTDDGYFANRIPSIKRFIKSCSEKITFPFVARELKNAIAKCKISYENLEMAFIDICSAVPIEHADKFTMIFYAMVTGYFEKTKNEDLNCQFVVKWMLSKYSFILTGFQHKNRINDDEVNYYPSVNKIFEAFACALHDPRLIDNVIKHNALEFTVKGLIFYGRNNAADYENFIKNMMQSYYRKIHEEKSSELCNGIFVNEHGADARRFSYTIYKKILTETTGVIASADFNEPLAGANQSSLPGFIYDAILKVLFTAVPGININFIKKITNYATTYSTDFKCDKNYADYLCCTYKAQPSIYPAVRTSIEDYLAKNDIPSAILLFKNLPSAAATSNAIELFKSKNRLPELIEGIQKFEFVDWGNETPIYNMLKENNSTGSVEKLLRRMSMQASCFFAVPAEEVDNAISTFIEKHKNIGSLAFVCRNDSLLKSLRDDLDGILESWDFAQNLQKFYNGIISFEGVESFHELPFSECTTQSCFYGWTITSQIKILH